MRNVDWLVDERLWVIAKAIADSGMRNICSMCVHNGTSACLNYLVGCEDGVLEWLRAEYRETH